VIFSHGLFAKPTGMRYHGGGEGGRGYKIREGCKKRLNNKIQRVYWNNQKYGIKYKLLHRDVKIEIENVQN